MTKEDLVHNVKNGMYLKLCDKNIKELFSLLTGGKNMLVFSKSAEKSFSNLEGNEEFKKFLPLVEDNLISQLIKRISKLYKTMSFNSFKKLTGFLSFEKCENQILYANTQGMSIRLNMNTNMLIFGHEKHAGEGVSTNMIDFFNNLGMVEKSLNRILMKNNRDWDRLVSKSVILAKTYLENAEEDIRDRKEKIRDNQDKRQVEEARMASITAK